MRKVLNYNNQRNVAIAKTFFIGVALVAVFLISSCFHDKSGTITRTWKLEKIKGKIDTTTSAFPSDQYHTVLYTVINEHKKHHLVHKGITWVFNADSTFKIIITDNSNETDDNRWKIKGDTIYLAVWHNDFYFKFKIEELSDTKMILENDELGKTPIILIFSGVKTG